MSGEAISHVESGEVSVNIGQWMVCCDINRRSYPLNLYLIGITKFFQVLLSTRA